MTCDNARDWLFDDQEGLLDVKQRALLRAHLTDCADCRAEQAALAESYALLARDLREMAASITPSPAFWTNLNAGLDAIDAERRALKPATRPRTARAPWHSHLARRWAAAIAVITALIAGSIASGQAQQAWAALRQHFSFLPAIGIGQVEPSALVSTGPVSTGNGQLTLTVRELVAGRHTTLLAYQLGGADLQAPSSQTMVADAVDAVLVGAHGHRYIPTSYLQAERTLDHGAPVIHGLLAFAPLARDERSVRLSATRLPLTPPASSPWSLTMTLRPAGTAATQTSIPLNGSTTHAGVRVTVTDLIRTADSTVVDMSTAIESGPYVGGSVVSLDPDQAVGDLAPVLITGGTHGALSAGGPALPLPVRRLVFAQPEFVFGPLPAHTGTGTLRLPALQVRLPIGAATSIPAQQARTVRLGAAGTVTVHVQLVTPPAGLGLDGTQRARLTVAFPPADNAGTLQRLSVVVDGVSWVVSRDDPHLDLPQTANPQTVHVTLDNPVVTVRGPWVISLPLPTR